ncbi:MAG: nucleotidyltransferase domain-containing protein [Bacteroidota bacterium]
MTIAALEERSLILLKCRSGSHAYGLATATSDEDFRGVFYLPREEFYGMRYLPQVSDAKNDEVYYEVGRFVELLTKANPTALELLASPPEAVLYRSSLLDVLRLEDFLTRACRRTFAGYATTQVRKARGLNKKVKNPMERERKRVEQFCYVIRDGRSIPLLKWTKAEGIDPTELALARVDHAPGVYALYHDPSRTWAAGISGGPQANDVNLSNVPKTADCRAHLFFNRDGYSVYCRNHREYWQWVADRNEERYVSTLQHGQGYDAKNMMHTIRLLDVACEIMRDGRLNVRRPDREFLLRVKAGAFPLEEVLGMAEARLAALEEYALVSTLPEFVDTSRANGLLAGIRKQLYH